MFKHDSRTKATFAFSLVAASLVVASVAYACVPFAGKLQVTPLAGGRTTGSQVVGDGSTTNLQFCASPDGRASVAGTAAGGEQITVAVSAATTTDCTARASQLSNGSNYSVIINNSNGTDTTYTPAPFSYDSVAGKWNVVAGTGCFRAAPNTPAGNITLATNFSVTSGAGSATYTLPTMHVTNTTTDASSVCVGKAAATGYAGEGIFAPLRIVAL